MGLLSEGCPAGQSRGPCPLHPGAQVAPREQTAAVQRIPEGPHLRQHGVQPKARRSCPAAALHPARKVSCRGEIQQRPVQIAHPHRPPLAGGQGGVGVPGALSCSVAAVWSASLFCGAATSPAQPRRRLRSAPSQKGCCRPKRRGLHLRFRRPAALGHRVSSCVLYRVSAAQPRAQASSTNMMFVQKARPLMPA